VRLSRPNLPWWRRARERREQELALPEQELARVPQALRVQEQEQPEQPERQGPRLPRRQVQRQQVQGPLWSWGSMRAPGRER